MTLSYLANDFRPLPDYNILLLLLLYLANMYTYLNGKWVETDKASISILDIAVLRGFGIFDFLRTYGQKPHRLQDHIDRFYKSSRIMGLTPQYSKEEMEVIINEGIIKNGFENTNIKMIQTGGVSHDGFTPNGNSAFFVYFYEAVDYPDKFYQNGIAVRTTNLMRQLPDAKSINYGACIVEVIQAAKKGAKDVLHTDADGNIYEATRSNFFAVKNGKLITADKGILMGITRTVILELAHELNIEIKFQFPKRENIKEYDETFITSSSLEVMPVVKIDDITIGNGKPGEVTKKLHSEFRKNL